MLGLESVPGRRQAPGAEVGAVPGGGTRRPENWLELGGRVSLWGPSPQDTGRRSPCKEGRACRAENGPALEGHAGKGTGLGRSAGAGEQRWGYAGSWEEGFPPEDPWFAALGTGPCGFSQKTPGGPPVAGAVS